MQILPVNNYPNNNKTSFKNIIITEAGNKALGSLNPQQHLQFSGMKKELGNLIHWDMIIDKSKNWMEIIHIKFVNKFDKNMVHEIGITPVSRNKNRVKVYSPYKTTEITFPNEERAKALMDMYIEQLNIYERDDIQHDTSRPMFCKIQEAVKEIKFLDEAYEYMAKINPNLYSKAEETETDVVKTPTKKSWLMKLFDRLCCYDE